MEQTLTPTPPAATGFDLRSRLRAAGIHLALSVAVALIAAALVFLLSYPMPFREVSGGRELFLLVVTVDVVLGPLITFAVFNRRKPWRELRRDLAIVVLLQLAALGYGLHTVFVARPVAVVLEIDRLKVVTAAELQGQDPAEIPPQWRAPPWWGYQVLAAHPASKAETGNAVELAMQGFDIGVRPRFWGPPSEAPEAIDRAAKPLATLRAKHLAHAAGLDEAVAASGLGPDRLKYLPLVARLSTWSALIESGTGRIVGYVPLDGF